MKKSILVVFVFIAGCTLAKVNVEVVSNRTALENQVLGTYNAIDKEMLLASSVRGVDPLGRMKKPKKISGEQEDAIQAVQIMDFHDDDVKRFKRLGWVGENNKGLLTAFDMKRKNPPDDLRDFSNHYSEKEFQYVTAQVNSSRKIIMKRVIDMNENLAPEDILKVMKVFAKLNQENALPGELVQGEDGKWMAKNTGK